MDILEHNLDSSGEAEVVGLVDSKEMLHQDLTIVEEGSLGSGSEGQSGQLTAQHLLDTSCGDDEVQYAFRTGDNTTVTYRVVQVDDTMDPLSQIVTSSNFPAGSLPHVVTAPINGHLYVLGNSAEVFTGSTQRNIAPRSVAHINNVTTVNSNTKKRDDRRRATHNEVERRRRDKINNWIIKLSKIIPDMGPSDITKGNGAFEGQSKGGILAKACDYIMELRQNNQNLNDQNLTVLKDNEKLVFELESLRTQNGLLKKENATLRQQLQANGICVPNEDDDGDPLAS